MERHPEDIDADLPEQLPLAPCPFCGTTPTLLAAMHRGFYVSCENAQCAVSPETTFDTETREQAAERWNTRSS